jgi:ankyrin repeat protein
MLNSATYYDHINIVKFLVEEVKVDIDQTLKNGETALLRGCHFNRINIVKYLLENGASPEGYVRVLWSCPMY